MAISKKQATEASDRITEACFKKAEKEIDALLSGGTDPRTWDTKGYSRAVLDRVVAAYKAVGWHVRLVYDKRDGDYLQFS